MFESLAQGASHPAVAAWFGLGAAAVAAVVVAMAWSVNVRQIRLAELLARRQFPVSSGNVTAKESTPEVEGGAAAAKEGAARAKPAAKVPPEVIDGPDEVVAGEQARYRVQTGGPHQVVSWAVGGGGAVSHGPDPGHPGDLLLIAEQPGDLTLIARVREGLTERRATKTITAVPEVAEPTPPFSLRLFLHGWGLIVVAVLIVGFAGALNALGNFTSSDFIAVAVPLAALLGVLAVARGPGAGEPGRRPGNGHGRSRPRQAATGRPGPAPRPRPRATRRPRGRPHHVRPHARRHCARPDVVKPGFDTRRSGTQLDSAGFRCDVPARRQRDPDSCMLMRFWCDLSPAAG